MTIHPTARLLIVPVLFLGLAACSERGPGAAAAPEAHGRPSLGAAMGDIQRYSQKLGYSIEGHNLELARFYLHELEEAYEYLIDSYPEYEGHRIAELTRLFALPPVEGVEAAMDSGDWDGAWRAYEGLIASCNACHGRTDHGFIAIEPARGEPPFNQRFGGR